MQHAGAGLRAGDDGDVVGIHGLQALRIGIGRHDGPPALAIGEQQGLPFRCEMPVAEGDQRRDHGEEVPALLRQQVLVALRPLAIEPPLEQSGFGEMLQAPRQHVRRDAEAALELVEAGEALQRIAQDQDAPPFADGLDGAGAGTFGKRDEPGLHTPQLMQ